MKRYLFLWINILSMDVADPWAACSIEVLKSTLEVVKRRANSATVKCHLGQGLLDSPVEVKRRRRESKTTVPARSRRKRPDDHQHSLDQSRSRRNGYQISSIKGSGSCR